MESYPTFEAFRPHFNVLAGTAYFKIVKKDVSRTKRILHDCYRFVVWVLVLSYNVQHVISLIQARNVEEMAGTLLLLLTTISSLGKQFTFEVRARRIEGLIAIVDGPLFAASAPHAVAVMKRNTASMARLLRGFHGCVTVSAVLFSIFPLANKARGQDVKLSGYFPFDTSKSPIFELASMYLNLNFTFQGYANVTMDCTIVSFYSQARVQIEILRHNLEHLFDGVENGINADMNVMLQQRFGTCVEHYRQVTEFFKEVQSVFFEAMFFQFLVMAWVICMTLYTISGLEIMSEEFLSRTVYLFCLLVQVFIYCYHGTQLKSESENVNQAVYFSDWLSASPAFRRQLLVMMECCARPFLPTIGYLVPMTLDTFITILKSSYTLFTVLD